MSATEPLRHLRASTANKRPTPAAMADGQLALNTNNTSPGLFFKDSNGALVKVGPVHVGTTAPNASPAAGGSTGNAIGEQWLDTAGGTYVFKVWDGSAWRSETGTFVDVNGDVMTGALGIIAGSAGSPGLYFSGDTNTGLFSPGADQVAISTGGSGRLFVDASGNVGVGTSTITGKLSLGASQDFVFGNQSSTGTGGTGRLVATGGEVYIQAGLAATAGSNAPIIFTGYGGVGERLRITAAGLVGVGTSTPDAQLDVTRSGNGQIAVLQTSAGRGFNFESQSDTQIQLSSILGSTNLDLWANTVSLSAGGSQRLFVDSSGRVGVGTTSPTAQIDSTPADGGNAYAIRNWPMLRNTGTTLDIGGYGSSQWLATRFYTNSSIAMMIDSSQRVGIGTTGPSGTLHVLGGSTVAILQRTGANACQINVGDSNLSNIYYDADAHIYRAGAGTERMRIDSSGRVGIGTSSPDARLEVNDQSSGAETFPLYVSNQGTGVGTKASIRFDVANTYYGSIGGGEESGIGSTVVIDAPGSTGLIRFTKNNRGTELARFDSSGRLGIGTTDASSLFSSDRNVRLSNASGKVSYEAVVLDGSNNHRVALFANNATGDLGLDTGSSSATYNGLSFFIEGSKKATIDRSGRLLVGTSSSASGGNLSPYAKLQIVGNTAGGADKRAVLNLSADYVYTGLSTNDPIGTISFNDNSGREFAWITGAVDGTVGNNDYPGRLVLSVTADGASSPTERMRITSAGNIFIGLTSTTGVATGSSVNQGAYFASGSLLSQVNDNANQYWSKASGYSSGDFTAHYVNNTYVGGISTNGTTTTYAVASDYRLKENMVALSSSIARLGQLKPIRFNFIGHSQNTVDGFVAHEVQQVVPEAVVGEKNAVNEDGSIKPQGIDQSKLVPLLTAALQEAVAKIESLEARLTAAGI